MANIRTSEEEAIDNAELEKFRGNLSRRRRELLNLYENDVRSGQESNDEGSDDLVDRANNSYNRELMFSLSDADRDMLIQVEEALKRLDDGTYGSCTYCSRQIGLPRLKAVSWARYCIQCQELQELGMLER